MASSQRIIASTPSASASSAWSNRRMVDGATPTWRPTAAQLRPCRRRSASTAEKSARRSNRGVAIPAEVNNLFAFIASPVARSFSPAASVEGVQVTLLYFDDCPNWIETDQHLAKLQAELPGLEVARQLIETPEEADQHGFRGSPSILVDGVDPFSDPDAPVGLSCRIYSTPSGPAGSPTLDQLRAALTGRS